MCGRYVLKTDAERLQARFGLRTLSDEPYVSYNMAPGRMIPSIVAATGEEPTLHNVRWGLEMKQGQRPLINARSETAANKPTFSRAFRERRCIVPADGFYEWSRQGGKAVPHLIQVNEGETFGMAGLLLLAANGGDMSAMRVVIITTDSAPSIRPIHHRMPAILAPNTYQLWLSGQGARTTQLQELLKPLPDGLLSHHRVSTRVNSSGNDVPALTAPIDR